MNIHVAYHYDYLRGPKWAKVSLLWLFTVVIQSKMFLVCAQLIFVHNFMFQTCFLFLHSWYLSITLCFPMGDQDSPDSVDFFFWLNSPQVLAADAGEYCLVFDNSYSWFKSKQIYYWYHVACGDKSTCS